MQRRAAWAGLSASAPSAVQDLQQLVDLGLPLALAAAMEGVRHAMPEVIAQGLLLDLVERRPHRANLGQDVDAVAFFLDHAGDAAHLTLDTPEARQLGFLQSFIHGLNYTPVGYR